MSDRCQWLLKAILHSTFHSPPPSLMYLLVEVETATIIRGTSSIESWSNQAYRGMFWQQRSMREARSWHRLLKQFVILAQMDFWGSTIRTEHGQSWQNMKLVSAIQSNREIWIFRYLARIFNLGAITNNLITLSYPRSKGRTNYSRGAHSSRCHQEGSKSW